MSKETELAPRESAPCFGVDLISRRCLLWTRGVGEPRLLSQISTTHTQQLLFLGNSDATTDRDSVTNLKP